ncbi:hypothetical protein ARMGADRAFT_999255 [Armillaria gallica]|uniref:Glycoside hydrolase family 76 protein n=1 Tax=Armillaria gallica TaxID=47427 RepID=A0A2H3CSS4_ARMGA|nr:hypothetical protein ARMGADRAFT_999255 [Armillaria gallica]
MRLAFISTLLALNLYSIAALDLTPSSSWRSPNITLSRDDRISIASSALEKAVSMLNQSNGQFSDGIYGAAGRLYAQMAEFDRLTNQTNYKDDLKKYFTLAESVKPDFLDETNYGYAAARAYNAYRDPEFLAFAVTSWGSARRYTISKEQAATGSMDVKQFNLTTSCSGATLAGGTYCRTDSSDTFLHGLASGYFLLVSALLAEATSNQMYTDAAVESADFIQSHLLDSFNMVGNTIVSISNGSCSVDLTKYLTHSGVFIEGFVILAEITQDTTIETLLRSTIDGVTTSSLWQGSDGVIDSRDAGGHYIVRALASLYERNTSSSSDLREYIKEYIGVQYNSIIEQARSSSENDIYGSPWTGTTSTSFDGDTQTMALTSLLSAIQLAENPGSSTIPTSSTTVSLPPQLTSTLPAVASSAKKNSAGIIAGSVVGGIVLLAALIFGTLFLRKLHRQRNDGTLVVNGRSPLLTPFTTTQNMASSGILREQHRRNQAKSARFPGVAMGGEPSSLGAADNGSTGIAGLNIRAELMASPGTQVASPENPPPDDRREHTLMEELLRSLNTRMSRNRWNAEELPPDYHEG